MNLVKIPYIGGHSDCLVNPAYITAIVPISEDSCFIQLSGSSSILCGCDVDTVMAILAGK